LKIRRNRKLLVDPPEAATGDIAFILIVFFLVCASVQPDQGREQNLPRSEEQEEKKNQTKNPTVLIKRGEVDVNDQRIKLAELPLKMSELLRGKERPEDRIVVVKSAKDTPYHFWIQITGQIEQAGGVITLQIEEEREVQVP